MASLTTVTNHFGTEDTALTYSFTVLKSRANETSDVTAFRITNLGDLGGSWTDSKGGIYTASANKGFVLYQAVAGAAAVEYALVYTSTGLNLYSYTAGTYSLAKSTGASLVWLPPADAYGTLTAFSVTGVSLSTTSFNQLTTNDVAVKVAVANVNDLPQYQSAQIIGLSTGPLGAGGVPAQGQTLVASAANVTDADGKGVVSWQWFSNGVAITGATGNSLTLTQALVDKKISVVGTYTDGGGTEETIVSDQTKAVANVNDAPTGVVTITGNAVQG